MADSLWLALSGPGAIALHEISMLVPFFKTKKDEKTAVVAAQKADETAKVDTLKAQG